MMAILEELSPKTFVYSIDEAFCCVAGIPDLEGWGRQVQAEIMRRIGLPVGVGIAPTKTLAKLANWAAKKWKKQTGCVVVLDDPTRREKLLRYAPVGEVWGIGCRLSARLESELRIKTAWELATTDPKLLRRYFSVNMERTARELGGIACFPFADAGPGRKQQIISSRTFGETIFSLEPLRSAITHYTSVAAAKLRAQHSLANCLQVYAQSSPFGPGEFVRGSRIIAMPYPTDDTRDLVAAALQGLGGIYREGVGYTKAGVVLSQFVERGAFTGDLFAPRPRAGSQALMQVVDAINARQGRGAIRLGSDHEAGGWMMSQKMLSPAFTTCWEDLPKARC